MKLPTVAMAHDCDADNCIEIIKDRLYFATLNHLKKPRSSTAVHYFSTDEEYVYARFFEDFGPLCLSAVYRYRNLVNNKLKSKTLQNKRIIHYCRNFSKDDEHKRVNSAFLMSSFMIIQLKMTPQEVADLFIAKSSDPFIAFRDAAFGPCTFQLTVQDCVNGLYKAMTCQFFDIETFNVSDYEYYEKVENGDFNWIVDDKFLAFCGPHSKSKVEKGAVCHGPESYINYFKSHSVTDVVRLNKKLYDAQKFTDAGIRHHDLYFLDGGVPSDDILQQFLTICETAAGAVAVHCKAGLGRTGTLIGCYLMKHHRLSANEAIAWLRIARPGSVIGPQQYFMERKQKWLWSEGELFHLARQMDIGDGKVTTTEQLDLGVIMTCVNDLNLVDSDIGRDLWSCTNKDLKTSSKKSNLREERSATLSQGDRLNLIKLCRQVKMPSEASSSNLCRRSHSPRSLAMIKRSRSANQKAQQHNSRPDSAKPSRAGSNQNLCSLEKSSCGSTMPVRVTRSSFRF